MAVEHNITISQITSTTDTAVQTRCVQAIRELKQARTATTVNKQLNFTFKNKPHVESLGEFKIATVQAHINFYILVPKLSLSLSCLHQAI